MEADFQSLMVPVAKTFWGEPNPQMSKPSELRWGSGGGRSVDVAKGVWTDWTSGSNGEPAGGGVIDLVMTELASDKATAVKWLEDQGFIGERKLDRHPESRQEPEERESAEPPADSGTKKPVKGYRYVSADGEPLYEVIRYQFVLPDGSFEIDPKTGTPKKTFLQRRPDGHGGHHWNLEGIGHTIYRHNLVEQAIAEGKTIYLPEGEKDVETLEAWGLVASTNSGGAKNWTDKLAAYFKAADVVILIDNDDAGRARGEKVARSLRGIASRIRLLDFVPLWSAIKDKFDVTDWRDAGGTKEQFLAFVEQLSDWAPAAPASKFGAVGLDQLHHPSLRHDFAIDDFLDRQGVAMMPGASGSGKTFLVLEMAMCTALSLDFLGMKVKQGVVLYQAGEGKQGVTKRLDGWLMDRGISAGAEVPFKMLTRRINLFNDDKDTDEIIEEGKRWSEHYGMPIRMVVIDTFNKAITGANENAGQDMTKVIARLERISIALDCAVVVPIHKSAEGKMRGHTSLTGDVANVINVTELAIRDRNGRVVRTIQLDKNKDGEKGKPLRFVLRQVVLEVGADGKAITTCVLDKPDGDEEEAARHGRLSLNQIVILKALREALEDFGEDAPNGLRTSVKRVVKYQSWKDRVRKSWAFAAGEEEPEKRNAELERVMGHAGKVLLAGEYIGRDNDLKIVWSTGKDDRPKRVTKPIEKPKPSPAMTAADMDVPF